ncbi:tumor necrosis factor receptor superfamily member 3-like [Mustelus asterias]
MLCFKRKPTIIAFLILILVDLIKATTGLPKLTPEHQRFKRQVTLQKCPPGKYVASSRSSKNQTKCASCEEGTYTEKENFVNKCRKCYGRCTGNSVQTVQCTPTTNRKCECPPHHYCSTEDPTKCEHCKKCDDKKLISPDKQEYYKQACQPCPLGTFLDTMEALKCQPHTNCTLLGMKLHIEGNSTFDNYCIVLPTQLPNQPQEIRRPLTSFMMWILFPLSILCIIVIVRSSFCRIPKKQGIGMLVKLKFICICGFKSDLYKGRDNEPEISVASVPEIGEHCEEDMILESKPTAVMIPLIDKKKTEAPTLEYKSEIRDNEAVSTVVHPKDNAEDNIPFPVQENGRNSSSSFPIEEQSQKQYNQSIMIEAKDRKQTCL